MSRPAALWRYVLVLAFASIACCNNSAIGANAFAPLLQSPRSAIQIRKSKGFFQVSSVFSFSDASRMTAQESDRIHRRMARNEDNGETPIASTKGVPSSPLDRPVLSTIDATALFVFAGIGKASHSAVDGSLDVAAVLVTAFPFLVSWFLVAPLAGSYTPEATKDVKSAAVQAAKGWILAVPMGCILRGVIKGYVPPVPFVIVTLISTLVILSMGRVGYTVLSELYVEMF